MSLKQDVKELKKTKKELTKKINELRKKIINEANNLVMSYDKGYEVNLVDDETLLVTTGCGLEGDAIKVFFELINRFEKEGFKLNSLKGMEHFDDDGLMLVFTVKR